MPRLVDANEILKSEHQHYDYMADEYYVLVRDIENAPTVDAVEIVRCKDCKYYNLQHHYCEGIGNWFGIEGEWGANDYCSKGERKEDATND